MNTSDKRISLMLFSLGCFCLCLSADLSCSSGLCFVKKPVINLFDWLTLIHMWITLIVLSVNLTAVALYIDYYPCHYKPKRWFREDRDLEMTNKGDEIHLSIPPGQSWTQNKSHYQGLVIQTHLSPFICIVPYLPLQPWLETITLCFTVRLCPHPFSKGS